MRSANMASSPAPDLRRAALWAGLAWLTCCVVLIWLAHGRFSTGKVMNLVDNGNVAMNLVNYIGKPHR